MTMLSPNIYIARLETSIGEMREWMAENHLKLNDDKTEFIVIIGQKQLLNKVGKEMSIAIGNTVIKASTSANNIGTVFDSHLDMKMHISCVTRASYHQLRTLGRIRPNITAECAATLTHAFISSKLDNLNSLLTGLPDHLLKKL